MWRKLYFFFCRREFDRDLAEEIRQHLEMKTQKLIADGVPPDEARYQAQRAFGNTLVAAESSRAIWQWRPLEEIAQDLRYALRLVRRNPGFMSVAVLSLALGIGANTAIFSLIDAVMLKTLPVDNPRELVLVSPQRKNNRWIFKNPTFRDIRERQQVLAGMFAISDDAHLKVTPEGRPEALYAHGSIVSGNYFTVLGLRAALGRVFTDADDRIPGSMGSEGGVAVISHGFWQREFSGDPNVPGRKLTIGRISCTVIGVTPRDFHGHQAGYAADVWVPMSVAKSPADLNQRNWAFFSGVMGRLKPGIGVKQAQASMTALYQQILSSEVAQGIHSSLWGDGPSVPPDLTISDYNIRLEPGGSGLAYLSERFSKTLGIVMAVVALVLLIACANVASLLLARAMARRGEIGLRLALGSSRFRLLRQLLTESVLVAAMGASLGLVLAHFLSRPLAAYISIGWLPITLDLSPDARVLAFTAGLSVITAILFGLIPAWQAAALDVSPALKGLTRGQTTNRGRQRIGKSLVTGQIALSLLLLVGAGLLARSLENLHSVDPGFYPNNVLMLNINIENLEHEEGKPDFAVEQTRLLNLYRLLDTRLNGIAGVRSASFSWLGLFGGSDLYLDLSLPGTAVQKTLSHVDYVSSRYFETLGMKIQLGRGFEARDNERSPHVAVINESFARKHFGGLNPIGKLVAFDFPPLRENPFQIVGVLRDTKYNDLRTGVEPMIYLPLLQAPFSIQSIEVRTAGDPLLLAPVVRQTIREVSSDVAISELTTLARRLDSTLVHERMLAQLSGLFGALALLLACVGLYGTMSYAVARRTNEIGIRMAMGARQSQMLWMVLRDVLVLAGMGIAIGLPAALAATRLLDQYLFGLKPGDPATIAAATALLLAIAMLAGYVPARRAARVDPMTALRYE